MATELVATTEGADDGGVPLALQALLWQAWLDRRLHLQLDHFCGDSGDGRYEILFVRL